MNLVQKKILKKLTTQILNFDKKLLDVQTSPSELKVDLIYVLM